MVDYNAQVNQMPNPYYSSYPPVSSKKRMIGGMLAGGLLGMTAQYLPVSKDAFVQRAFDMKRNNNYEQIISLKNIAQEVEKGEVTTQSKMILQEMGLTEDVTSITNKCIQLEKEISDPTSVKTIKDRFIDCFQNCKKKTSIMDSECADAFRAVKRNKFRWGIGIGAGIGLALGLMGSRD